MRYLVTILSSFDAMDFTVLAVDAADAQDQVNAIIAHFGGTVPANTKIQITLDD